MPNRAFNGLLAFLREEKIADTQEDQAKALKLQQPQVSSYSSFTSVPKTPSWWARLFRKVYRLGYNQGQRDTDSKLMKGLVETFGEIPQAELAGALGVSQQAISSWLRGFSSPSKLNFERLLALHVVRLVEPVIEFWEIDPHKNGDSWRFTSDLSLQASLRKKLEGEKGIYVFYDSAGRVTYIGKTATCLWKEPRQRLKASVNRTFYNPTKSTGKKQGDVARYISAYHVRVPEAVHNLEVLMLRAIPNDAANTNTGNFKSGV